MGIFNFLKADPFLKPLDDKTIVRKQYRYWRMRVFYSMYIGYALFYFTRKSFTFSVTALMDDLNMSMAKLGFLGSLMAISYAGSKFLSGILSDKSNLRYFMGIGLILTGIFNILFGLSSSIVLFGIFWGLNGLFQGWGAPPCAKLLTYWYSQSERGRWWGLWNTSHNIGGALIPIVCATTIQMFGWRYAMYLPGIVGIVIGFLLINRLRDDPRRLGLPSIEKFRNDYPADQKGQQEETQEEKPLTSKEILVKHVLKNKYIWILAISFFFVYIIRQSVNDWIHVYLMKSKGFSLMSASSCVFWFEIGGLFGSLAAGWLSDIIFMGRRGPVNILFSAGVILSLFALWVAPGGSIALVSAMTFMIGFLIFGPQMLIGMAAAELATKEAAGTATGFAGLFAYLGAATAGYPVGKIIQEFGWMGYFVLLGACGTIAVAFLLPLWGKKTRPELAEIGT